MVRISARKWKDEKGNIVWLDDFNNYIIIFSDGTTELAKTLEKAEKVIKRHKNL
jgi:hypothetical protein